MAGRVDRFPERLELAGSRAVIVARELQDRVLDVLELAIGRRVYPGPTPDWLLRPAQAECGTRWALVRRIYRAVSGGMSLSPEMPPRETRAIDGLIGGRGHPWQLVEVDESQHFNFFRSQTLDMYPGDVPLGFPPSEWIAAGRDRIPSAGGGWGAPRPPLFPMAGGRHRQRAFRDTLADLVPELHGFGPTIRIADFEVEPWIWDSRGAAAQLRRLIEDRIASSLGPPGRRAWTRKGGAKSQIRCCRARRATERCRAPGTRTRASEKAGARARHPPR